MKVCFVTLSRSDYASLAPVLRAALAAPGIEATLAVGGSHLLERYGRSIDDVRRDGFAIEREIDFLGEGDDSAAELAHAQARACAAFADYFQASAPERVFLLGDRWELLAAAGTASLLRIPILHHSGGDITQGSTDNQTRYALTALAHQHLVAHDEHRRRLLAIGEESWRVTHVGEPALVGIDAGYRGDIRAELGVGDRPFALATWHPTVFDRLDFAAQAALFTRALELLDIDIVLTAPNPDPGSGPIHDALARFAAARPAVHLFDNLGAERYHAAMAEAEFMIGNSSSGIWEAPSFGLPVVNIGNRQQDRLRGDNVIDTAADLDAIRHALAGLDAVRARPGVRARRNPYLREDTLAAIVDAIGLEITRERLLAKHFVDPLGP